MLKDWKEEFYPIEALCAIGTELEAVEHSLQKWRGLTEKNLDRHEVCKEGGVFIANCDADSCDDFEINSSTCALCVRCRVNCSICPLALARGGVSCDSNMDEEENSPYHEFTVNDNPSPMIQWLKKTRQFVLAER